MTFYNHKQTEFVTFGLFKTEHRFPHEISEVMSGSEQTEIITTFFKAKRSRPGSHLSYWQRLRHQEFNTAVQFIIDPFSHEISIADLPLFKPFRTKTGFKNIS